MGILKKTTLFCVGGGGYYTLELLWRGRSHSTMFVLGGICFLLLGKLEQAKPRLPTLPRLVMGSVICTSGELLFGLLFNRSYNIWDYRHLPLNLGGQICALFSALWIPVSGFAMWLYNRCSGMLERTAVHNSMD